MTEFTVHYRNYHLGSLRMVTVDAETASHAEVLARAEITRIYGARKGRAWRLTRVDHFEDDSHRLVIDR